jgi:hypothetical protein
LGFVGKYLYASKSDVAKHEVDMNNMSSKIDGGFHTLDMKIVTVNNSNAQSFAEKISLQSKEIMDTVYQKFLTKEMSEKNEQMHKEAESRRDQKIEKLETGLEYIRQKVDKNETDNQVNAEKIDNILEIVKTLSKEK